MLKRFWQNLGNGDKLFTIFWLVLLLWGTLIFLSVVSGSFSSNKRAEMISDLNQNPMIQSQVQILRQRGVPKSAIDNQLTQMTDGKLGLIVAQRSRAVLWGSVALIVVVSGLIPHLSISQSLVFLLNSRLGHFSAPASLQDPFFRSYRVNLPNSLAMTHSSTFGYSPRPPVSVCGTGGQHLMLSGFSRELASHHCHLGRSLGVLSCISRNNVLDCCPYT